MERRLIDMRKYSTEKQLTDGYTSAADCFCKVINDEIDCINRRMSDQFPGWGWSVVDMDDTSIQLMSIRTEKATGINLFGPTIVYRFGYKSAPSHKNYFMDAPEIDETVRKMNDEQSEMIDVCKDESAALRVANNIQFANYIEVEMMQFLERFFDSQDDMSQFRDEFIRRGLKIPDYEV